MDKLLSIIIPVYNVEKFLKQCLDSVFAQTISDFEVICVNDGSTDSSADILEEYKQKYENMVIYTQVNGGLSAARNAGIKIASGKYIGFVDSDDFIEADMYRAMVLRAEQDNAQIVVSNPYIYDSKTHKTYVYRNMIDFLRLSRLGVFAPTNCPQVFEYIGAWDKLYLTEFLKENQLTFPVGRIFEDAPFTYAALSLASHVSVIKESYYYYRKNAGASITDKERINDEYKYDFLKNSKEIKAFLKECKCYEQVAPVFLEYFMRMGMYHHSYATTKKAFKRIFSEMRDLVNEYDCKVINDIGIEKFIWYSQVLYSNDKRKCYKQIKEKQLAKEVKVTKKKQTNLFEEGYYNA